MRARKLGTFAIAALAFACGGDPDEDSEPAGPAWEPGTVYRTARAPTERGLLDRRGLVHAHSVYSHDACDDEPRDAAGNIKEDCVADFRRGLCQSGHDFVFLTDHPATFTEAEFPDVFLYRPDQGDAPIERGGGAVASWLACPEGDPPLVMAGSEGALMPVGLERHVGTTPAERDTAYGDTSATAMTALEDAGAIVLAQHTEDWSADELATKPFGGFEMYNLHANALTGAAGAIALIGKLNFPEELPHPELTLLPIVNEDPRYLERWGSVLARGVHRTTTIGTDCHQNSFPQLLPDGERIDSYRRMMTWMSNHLLVRPLADGSFGDVELKEALRAGRLYGAFEVLGYPKGFDFHAVSAGSTFEMGDVTSLASGVELHVAVPHVERLDPAAEGPVIAARLLRAREAGWDLIAESSSDIVHPVTEPGAYRVEIRMQPRHLRAFLASFAGLAEHDFVWIYSNAIYVE